ncbi:hypothetical protein MLD38_034502 [Melastoma candidum]|uniref:Uncharacterized protein n=1 Tax=Melastoma candidum TaxID=119954 RepID=A0ACB9MAQ4_9MYRT|nr:hypothetical protein MLD38_034502 [Melastoma candidum]
MDEAAPSGCPGFFKLGSSNVCARPRNASSSRRGSPAGCGRIDGVATWAINGIAAAFFASLERCSCIRIATVEGADDGNDLPLILNQGNYLRYRDGGIIGTRDVRRRPAAGGGKRRGRFMEED